MKLKIYTMLLFLSLVGFITNNIVDAAQKSFSDVSNNNWAKKEINYLVDRGVINGYPNGKFGINDSITRAQAAAMIIRSFGWGSSGEWENPGYSDVKTTYWAYDDIAAVYYMDIFKPAGRFQPELPVTRGEMADMLVKAFQLSSIMGTNFSDVSYDHPYFQSINILAGNQITTGYSDGTYRPDAKVTRAEFAVFMTRALEESYRLEDKSNPIIEGQIYELAIGNQSYKLTEPLILTTDKWYAPIELFEKLGFIANTPTQNQVVLIDDEGLQIDIAAGYKEIWVGETSVEVDEPIKKINGQYYIEAHGILTALAKPLVFYPDQFLIALEAPKVTTADINKKLPKAAVDVIHQKQPYWQWSKRDRDYLELMRKQGRIEKQRLQDEMKQLTDSYYKVEQEKQVINGLVYYEDNVTGKIDAISRGLEARFLLLTNAKDYQYPAVGKSGSTGIFGTSNSRYQFDYLAYDHFYEYYIDNTKMLIDEIKTFTTLDLKLFEGLTIHGIPFSIREQSSNGEMNTWSGLASGVSDMLVVNSSVSTFYHELGHNWDAGYGDHDEYLKLRNKSKYQPAVNVWANRVVENFAEDFRVAIASDDYNGYFNGVFGMPTKEEQANIREWIMKRSQAADIISPNEITVNGATLIPNVLYAHDGRLQLSGKTNYPLLLKVVNLETGEKQEHVLSAEGEAFNEIITVPLAGKYEVIAGHVSFKLITES